jgi:hypothetical protein
LYCQVKNKVERRDVVHSGCNGLCVTEQFYSLPAWLAVTVELYRLPAWLAGAVKNNNRYFVVVVVSGPLCKNVV